MGFNRFFLLLIFGQDFSLNILYIYMKSSGDVNNISVEGTLSQISYVGSSFHFIRKNEKLLVYFLKHFFLDFIKQKLKPIEII